MEIKPPANLNPLLNPMKNLLVKLLPLLAIVIATPAFAGTNDDHHDRSNRYNSSSEYRGHHDRSHAVKHPREYVKVKVITRQTYSPRAVRQEVRREIRRHHEYRGYRGHGNNYYR
jgi:hypothetical protein